MRFEDMVSEQQNIALWKQNMIIINQQRIIMAWIGISKVSKEDISKFIKARDTLVNELKIMLKD